MVLIGRDHSAGTREMIFERRKFRTGNKTKSVDTEDTEDTEEIQYRLLS